MAERLAYIQNCDKTNVRIHMTNDDNKHECKAFINCMSATIIKHALMKYDPINDLLCNIITNLNDSILLLATCVKNNEMYYIEILNNIDLILKNGTNHYINKLIAIIKNTTEKLPVGIVDSTDLLTYLEKLIIIFGESFLSIYRKKTYDDTRKGFLLIKKEINDYQLIKLKNHITGFYRSAKSEKLVKIKINTIEYLHEDLDKKHTPGITFTYDNPEYNKSHNKKFLNFLHNICIVTNETFNQLVSEQKTTKQNTISCINKFDDNIQKLTPKYEEISKTVADTNCDISNAIMNNNDDKGNCKAFIDCDASLIIKNALIEYREINKHLCFMINSLTKISESVKSCNVNNFTHEISILRVAITQLVSLINTNTMSTSINASPIKVDNFLIDYKNLSKFLKDLETKLSDTELFSIYKKDCKKYNIFSKQLIKMCNTLNKEIINNYQLIKLKIPIIGYYRSNKIFFSGYTPININTIEYLHKDLHKNSYNPGITFTIHNKDNKDKKFLNFLDQICILDKTDFKNLAIIKFKKNPIMPTHSCDESPKIVTNTSPSTVKVYDPIVGKKQLLDLATIE